MAPVRAAVYCTNDAECSAAQEALARTRPDDIVSYDGVLEGWLDREGLNALVDRGIVVDPLDAEAAELDPIPHLTRQAHVGADDPALERLKATVQDPEPRVLQPEPDAAPEVAAYHIRLEGPISGEQRRAFKAIGVDLAAFEPPDLYRTRLTREQYGRVLETPGVRAVERYRFEETVTRPLLDDLEVGGDEEQPALLAGTPEPPRQTYDLVLHRVADLEEVTQQLRQLDGVEVRDSSHLYIRFEAPTDPALIGSIASLPTVRRLAIYQPASLMVARARPLVGVEKLPWTGDGECVAVFDSGIDREHPDLTDRITSVEKIPDATEEDRVGHGTHVAGIIAGTGAASNGKVRGIAPGAQLAIVGFVGLDGIPIVPLNWADLMERAVTHGAHIINLSAGVNFHGHYDFGSLAMDEFVWEHPDVLVVIAAGNSGIAPNGWVELHTIGSPASAKNVLTVGASNSDRTEIEKTWGTYSSERFPKPPSRDDLMCGDPDYPAALSSRGPTDSEAVKPEVLAPGTYILAARAEGTSRFWDPAYEEGPYAYLGGTSMAAPVVAGCAAVLREYLRTERQVENPSAALLKAILIASARRVHARELPCELKGQIGFPDYDQGFGRVDLTTVLPHDGAPAKRKLEWDDVARDSPKALASRGSLEGFPWKQSYGLTVAEGATEPLRVVLTWTDWPSDSVQNNLHLKLTGADGTPAYGNAEHWPARRKTDAFLQEWLPRIGQRAPALDKRNTVEQLEITDPAPGSYTLDVFTENTPKPPQGYAVCVVGELETGLSQ
jgi:subtilisin family serine protease